MSVCSEAVHGTIVALTRLAQGQESDISKSRGMDTRFLATTPHKKIRTCNSAQGDNAKEKRVSRALSSVPGKSSGDHLGRP